MNPKKTRSFEILSGSKAPNDAELANESTSSRDRILFLARGDVATVLTEMIENATATTDADEMPPQEMDRAA